jgi:sec-independent protein translocase protein TatB
MLGGLSMTEILIILGLALLLLGPDQLPSLAKSLGKGLRELRKATDDIKGQFESEIARIDLDEQPQKSIAPVPSPPDAPKNDAQKAPEPPANPADDPGAARAAARRAAAESQLKLVAPEGTVPRKPDEPQPAAAAEPKA